MGSWVLRSAKCSWYLAPVAGAGVADLLDEVEDEPGGRDDHEDDEGY